MMRGYKFVLYNKYSTLVGDVDTGGGYAWYKEGGQEVHGKSLSFLLILL